jgi:hypothetical protein
MTNTLKDRDLLSKKLDSEDKERIVTKNIEDLFENSEFTENEKIVGKLVFLHKLACGIRSRGFGEISHKIGKSPLEITKETRDGLMETMGKTHANYTMFNSISNNIYVEAAKQLGISNERYLEIARWVYKNETNF